jgi:DNA-binding response OmpR family regulator
MHILLMDDEPQIRELLQRFFSTEGHQVTVASNGQEGWEYFSAAPGVFDLILADMTMPVLDGLSVLRRVREAGHVTPCVLMTGHANPTAEDGKWLATAALIYKPFDLDEMLRVVLRMGTQRT